MNIIIPIGGKGERFRERFDVPKPFIPVFEKEMLRYVLDYLVFDPEDRVFIIYYNLDEGWLRKITHSYNACLISIDKQTKGAAETIALGLEAIRAHTTHKKCVLLDCDTFYTVDVLSLYRKQDLNAVFYTCNTDVKPIFSYIQLDAQSNITRIVEKDKISDYANTGIYCFQDLDELLFYATQVVCKEFTFQGEYYTSCIIHQMIQDGLSFVGIPLDTKYVFNLGTPDQLDAYIQQTFLMLFDLDGTLIQSDDIYFNVLQQILSKYRLELSQELFEEYIQGQNDYNALAQLFPSCYSKILSDFSALKDELFCKHLETHKQLKVVPGALEFIEQVRLKGYKIAIVTNCNRPVAEAILDYLGITRWVDILVIGNECKKTKPDPEPYLQAIRYFRSSSSKAIIFEDSKAGIRSACHSFPCCVVGITTSYSPEQLLQLGAQQVINDYYEVEWDKLSTFRCNAYELAKWIKQSCPVVQSVIINEEKLKGGFISDVIGVQLETDEGILQCVLKLENKEPSFLSQMANDLDLYEREYYFYEQLSKFVPVEYPKFYGIIYNDEYQRIGILMQNLNVEEYRLNLNLNNEKIDVALRVIDRLAKLHAKFWGLPLAESFKDLKTNQSFVSWPTFVLQRWPLFEEKWKDHLTVDQLQLGQNIVNQFQKIQTQLSTGALTLCHGDVKSANIFYRVVSDGYEPVFIDWQYILHGKGVQDLVFFMIESFEPQTMRHYKKIFKDYYYVKLLEYGVQHYNKDDYNRDFELAGQYFPFFVAMWFGSLEKSELVDPNFPFFYIQKLFYFYSI